MAVLGELTHLGAVGVHHEDLIVAISVAVEDNAVTRTATAAANSRKYQDNEKCDGTFHGLSLPPLP